MKRNRLLVFAAVLCGMILALSLAGCSGQSNQATGQDEAEEISASEELSAEEEAEKRAAEEEAAKKAAEEEAAKKAAEEEAAAKREAERVSNAETANDWGMTVVQAYYEPGDPDYEYLYPPMFIVQAQNNTGVDVKDAVVCMVGWDANGLPVTMDPYVGRGDSYELFGDFPGINLAPGELTPEDFGWRLDPVSKEIASVQAIMYSYTDFDNVTHVNPKYEDWKSVYVGQKR